jgi:redox-sensitive bicupin YhaK (pirin superfamily)
MGLLAQTFALGPQWPTLDPFLFCAHHDDTYPPGTGWLGPDPSLLAGRNLGSDFAGVDGWNMYHGQRVPGFPSHPHRGFETISYVREGVIDHSDSLGAAARFGRGDVQWMTAGSGIVHSEMFPLLHADGPNPLELFQIWLNLPAEDKLTDPHFSMLWSDSLPRITAGGNDGPTTVITVIAGGLDGHRPPAPPPHSWAARDDTDIAIWHAEMGPGASWVLPPAAASTSVRTLYLFEGGPLSIDDSDHNRVDDGGQSADIAARTGAVLEHSTRALTLTAGGDGASWMLLQGRPIGEPVAQYGPFVMNDRAGIEQAFADYQRSGFGGWPWPTDDPHHGPDEGRFAHHADGRLERADAGGAH